jgi:hypothetical protein
MIPIWHSGTYIQDTTSGYWFQSTDTEHEVPGNILNEAIDTGISRRETTNESSKVIFVPGCISLMHAIEGPVPCIITSHTSIHVGGDVHVVGTIHRRGIIFWHVYFDLPDSITKYGIEWNVDLRYYLKTKPICRGWGTILYTVTMEAEILVEISVELIELPTQLLTHLTRVLGTTIKIGHQRIFAFRTA